MKPFTITLVISTLGSGGAERVLSLLANYWAANGWQVHLLTLDNEKETPFYPLQSGIVHRALGLLSKPTNLAQRIVMAVGRPIVLRSAIKATKPNVVLSFLDKTNVRTLLSTRGLRVPIIVSERSDPHHQYVNRTWRQLRRWLYPRATFVVAQTERAMSYFSPRVQAKGRIIPNPVMLPPEIACLPKPIHNDKPQKTLLALGRLGPEKGFDLLIEAFSKVAVRHPDWSLEIWGDGALRSTLEAQVSALGLNERIRLPGRTQQPFEKMREADLFVLSSRYEGFPNALCEAMACGLPVVSFDCASGPREIIRDGLDGVLVAAGDVEALGSALSRLMGDAEARACLSARAPEVLERFGLEKVVGMWEELIRQAACGTATRK